MRTYPILLTLVALQIATPISSAYAADDIEAKQLYVQSLAATCANCHGTEGHAISGATVPGLAGRSADELVAQMKAFRSGERKATIMHQIAKGFSEAQTQMLAEYFAEQKR
jgi:cytochrome c553